MAGEVRQLTIPGQQENASNPPAWGPLYEALSARVADIEGQLASIRVAVRALSLENEATLDAVKDRLGQARNVEQRCKKLLESMRSLVASGLAR